MTSAANSIVVRGASHHNLKHVSCTIPRDVFVVFTGVSGSGKSSLAFGTLYAEAERRYLESVSPYARRLFTQMPVPSVESITGLPPAVALQQQRGQPTTRSTVATVTTIGNLLRMLFSRAGSYPPDQPIIYADAFSTNTPAGACSACSGIGRVFDVTEASMVPDDSKTIREGAIAAWPKAWGFTNLCAILTTLGYDIDIPWRLMSDKDRQWILFTTERPQVPVWAGFDLKEVANAKKRKIEPSYQGTFQSAQQYVLTTYRTSKSEMMKKRVGQYMSATLCSTCHGKGLKPESLSVKVAGYDIAEISQVPIKQLDTILQPYTTGDMQAIHEADAKTYQERPDKLAVSKGVSAELLHRFSVLLDLGLGYLSLDRTTPTLSPGEMQRLRIATQLRSNLFACVYVVDEPSAGLHSSDTEALITALEGLRDSGNSVFVVEHDPDVIKRAEWIIDVGPKAGTEGGEILYSGKLDGFKQIDNSLTAQYLFNQNGRGYQLTSRPSLMTEPDEWLEIADATRNNLNNLKASFPIGRLTTVTGVSGSGKSTLVSQVLTSLVADAVGSKSGESDEDNDHADGSDSVTAQLTADDHVAPVRGTLVDGSKSIKRMIVIDQKPIGRTPRSNLATYTGLFDHIRKRFAATSMAKSRKYDAGRFSFNVTAGRCERCKGEGSIMVELLFLPSVYTPCPVCNGARYNAATLQVKYKDKTISDVLAMTVKEAQAFFADDAPVQNSLQMLCDVGLTYLRLGQPATELSGGEAQRVKLATELQRAGHGHTLYVCDEPTTGLAAADVEKLMAILDKLVDAGNTVVCVAHHMRLIAGSQHVIDMGPGAGDQGGQIVVAGTPQQVAICKQSKTAKYLKAFLEEHPLTILDDKPAARARNNITSHKHDRDTSSVAGDIPVKKRATKKARKTIVISSSDDDSDDSM